MKLKKEDEEYIDSEINKQNTTPNNQEYYKKQNKFFLILSFVGILLSAILGLLFTPIGGQINIIRLLIITILFSFSVVYIFWSFLFWIIGLISIKSRENYKFKFIVKLGVAFSFTIVIIFLGSMMSICGSGNCNGRNLDPKIATTQLFKSQIYNPGAINCTDKVTFQNNSSLIAESITKDTGLDSSSQVFLANPEKISGFESSNSQILNYTGTTKKVVMCMICSDNGKTGLQQALDQYGINTVIDSYVEGKTLCLIYPKKAV